MARVSRAISSVYGPSVINRFIFGHGVVIYFINLKSLLAIDSEKLNVSLRFDPTRPSLFSCLSCQ